MPHPANTSAPIGWPLQLVNINLRLGTRTVLINLNATLNPCGRTVILGPNGAGKTALLRLLHGLQTPTSGTLHWGSQNNPAKCTQAYVPTSAVPFRRSVLANILLALHLKGLYGRRAERIALDALDICQLTPLIHQPARNLSSGETQKLFLARAWALGATTLLLDEPTANLDPTSSASIEALINDLHQNGVQIVLVTHNIAQARRLADEVVFLDQGCWCEQINAQTFFAQPKTRPARAYLAGQLY